MSNRAKVLLAFALYVGITGILIAVAGSAGRNEQFQPQNEFKLDAWIPINVGGIDLSVNKLVLYLVLASALTIVTMVWIARRMHQKPNRVQTAMEVGYDLTRSNIAYGNMKPEVASRWFPFVSGLFFFLFFSNLLGYVPLPTNTEETFSLFGLNVPSFTIYAATANISVPLALTVVVWFSYNIEGIRERGLVPYFRSWLPPGLESMNPFGRGAIFVIEVISHLVRLISLSVRLFANILAGHLLILFMAGGLAVLLGIAALGALTFPLAFVFYIFEMVLIATLQAFIFATLTAIYIGGATAESH